MALFDILHELILLLHLSVPVRSSLLLPHLSSQPNYLLLQVVDLVLLHKLVSRMLLSRVLTLNQLDEWVLHKTVDVAQLNLFRLRFQAVMQSCQLLVLLPVTLLFLLPFLS